MADDLRRDFLNCYLIQATLLLRSSHVPRRSTGIESVVNWTRCGRVSRSRVKLKINRLLGPRTPKNELAHPVAPKSQKEIGLLARGLLAYAPRLWGGRYIACPGGMTAPALIARSRSGPSPPACTSA